MRIDGELIDEAMIERLVRAFYERVRADAARSSDRFGGVSTEPNQ